MYCPNAILAIISNPVNSTVPIAVEVLKQKGVYNPKKVCGVTTLDVLRANTFVAEHMKVPDPSTVNVTVIGGHAGITILPLYSQVPGFTPTDVERDRMTVRTQFGGDEVVQAKAGTGSATLSMAYAGYIFTEKVVRALQGEPNLVQCAYVESSLVPNVKYFASPCLFGKDGVEQVQGYGTITDYEQAWLTKMIPELQKQITKGEEFVHSKWKTWTREAAPIRRRCVLKKRSCIQNDSDNNNKEEVLIVTLFIVKHCERHILASCE